MYLRAWSAPLLLGVLIAAGEMMEVGGTGARAYGEGPRLEGGRMPSLLMAHASPLAPPKRLSLGLTALYLDVPLEATPLQ